MKISYLKQKFWIGRSGHLVLLIQLQKRKNFLNLKKRDNKALRGCRHYVSWNVSLSVVLCRELSEITKENKTKTKSNKTITPLKGEGSAAYYMPYLRKKTPKIMNKSEENAWRERRMTNIVLLWRFLLDISVSVALKSDQRQKTFRGMTFHRNPPNVCKTSFRRSECCLDISLASGGVKITRWLFSIYTF